MDEKISALPTAGTEVANQPALDEPVERTGNVSQINHVPCGGTCNNTNPTLSNDGQIHDISLGIVTNLPSPSKDYNNRLEIAHGCRISYCILVNGLSMFM